VVGYGFRIGSGLRSRFLRSVLTVDGASAATLCARVRSVAAVDVVVAQAALDRIVASLTVDAVEGGADADDAQVGAVVAAPGVDRIVAVTGVDRIVAVPGEDPVVAATAENEAYPNWARSGSPRSTVIRLRSVGRGGHIPNELRKILVAKELADPGGLARVEPVVVDRAHQHGAHALLDRPAVTEQERAHAVTER
jgi:hypothetical protein